MFCRTSGLHPVRYISIAIATLLTIVYFLYHNRTSDFTSVQYPTKGNCDLNNSLHITTPAIVTSTGDANFFSTKVLTDKIFRTAYMATDLKLMFCSIYKIAHTQIFSLFKKRHSNLKGGSSVLRNPNIHKAENARFHPFMYDHSNKTQRAQVFQETTGPYNRFGLIRDPVDRFISGYLHICVKLSHCWKCDQPDSPAGLRCFIERQFEGIKRLSANNLDRSKVPEAAQMMFHFYPQSWFCGYHVLNYTKLFQLTPDGIDQMKKALVNAGWPSEQIYSGWGEQDEEEFMAEKPPHNTENARQKSRFGQAQIIELLSSNRTLAEYFARIYYSDYVNVNFNFTRPHWFDTQCEDCGGPCSDWAICYLAGRSTRCKTMRNR